MTPKMIYDLFKSIDLAIHQVQVNDEKCYQMLAEKQCLNYFFSKIEDVDWFDELQRRGFFKPSTVTQEEVPCHWPPLDYLEKISSRVREGKCSEFSEKLLSIIKEITEYKKDNGEFIDNYHIWYKFIAILCNLPSRDIHEFLKKNAVDFSNWLKVWLPSKFERSIVCSNLSTKLLPKFLTGNPADTDLAEKIVRSLLTIEYKENEDFEKRLSRKKREPQLQSDLHWVVDGLLKKGLSQKLGRYCSEDLISWLMNSIREMLQFEFFDNFTDLETDEVLYRVVLGRVQKDGGIEQGSFSVTVRKIAKGLYEKKKKEDFRTADGCAIFGDLVGEFPLSAEASEVFIRNLLESIGDAIPKKILETSKEKLGQLFLALDTDFTYISMRSLRSGSQYYGRDALDVYITVLRDLFCGKCLSEDPTDRATVEHFFVKVLTDDYRFPIFRRMALFIMTDHYDLFGEYFKKLLEIKPDIFYASGFDRDLYELLLKNSPQFKEGKERNFIENAIMFLPEYAQGKQNEKKRAYQRCQYFDALKSISYFASKMEILKKEAGIEEEVEAPAAATVQTWWGPGASYYDIKWFLDHDNSDIAKALTPLNDENRFRPEQKTVQATAEALKAAVKERPEKFFEDLTPFLAMKFIYINHLLRGFQDAWNAKKSLNWKKMLDFIRDYLQSEYFQNTEKDTGYDMPAYRSWIIGAAADLISSGTSDEKSIPEDIFEDCECLFGRLLERRWDKEPEKADIQESINTSFGRVLESYINFCLLKARVYDKDKKPRGFKKELYEKLLVGDKPETYTFLGRYLPNFMYLDKDWTISKIQAFKELPKSEKHWKGFFQGYVWGPTVYTDLFQLMHDHYVAAIENGHDYEQVQHQIAEHAALVYLYDFEGQALEGNKSLIRQLLDTNDCKAWDRVLDALRRLSKRAKDALPDGGDKTAKDKQAVERAKEFWFWFFGNVGKRFDEAMQSDLFASMARFVFLFDALSVPKESELVKHFKLIAPHADKFRDSAFFVEYLDRYTTDGDVEIVAEVFLTMLQNGVLPDYDKEHIKSIVKKIYKVNKPKANEIVEFYASKGLHFLRDLWEANIIEI